MSGRLAGKVAVITGSGSGIGQSIAIRFASEGATVVVDYRNHPDQALDTKAKAEAAGGKAYSSRPTSPSSPTRSASSTKPTSS